VRVSLSAKTAIRLRAIVRRAEISDPFEAEAVAELEAAIESKRKPKPIRPKRKKLVERMATAQLRAELVIRAGNACEACESHFFHDPHMDHFFGRANEPEDEEHCWMLCRQCDAMKTDEKPTRAFWLHRFRAHCEHHGYRVALAKVQTKLAREDYRKATE
jgi:hypothetical protein